MYVIDGKLWVPHWHCGQRVRQGALFEPLSHCVIEPGALEQLNHVFIFLYYIYVIPLYMMSPFLIIVLLHLAAGEKESSTSYLQVATWGAILQRFRLVIPTRCL